MNTPVVLDPDHAGFRRFQQSLINEYHAYLKKFVIDYRIIRDARGNVVAITPYAEMYFKDGSDMVVELRKEQSKTLH